MAFFGSGGVSGALHPSFQSYIECFHSSPFPKMFPRGGGIWDQDPMLMRDFREIRKVEIQLKNAQQELAGETGGGDVEEGGYDEEQNTLDQLLSEAGFI